eukprot:TRINITY_DN6569_c0_g4_i2.p1 TRINITY_DN6569_c0_g4~~TRINITY_DN6569_c0_g4_i2.p1  ORF type:complete len:241 (-),score=43.77 TRINITY_DN6569_c0_g4_i2:63-785(-)
MAATLVVHKMSKKAELVVGTAVPVRVWDTVANSLNTIGVEFSRLATKDERRLGLLRFTVKIGNVPLIIPVKYSAAGRVNINQPPFLKQSREAHIGLSERLLRALKSNQNWAYNRLCEMAAVSRVPLQAETAAQTVTEPELSQQSEPSPLDDLALNAVDLAVVDVTMQSIQTQLDQMVSVGLLPTDSLDRIREMLFDCAVSDAYKRHSATAAMADANAIAIEASPPVLPLAAAYAYDGECD